MAESGFISLELSRSQAPVTISKTAILFAEADNDTLESTHLHCVGGITHTVNGVFNDIAELLPRFIKTHRRDNGQPAVAIHDWNVSYIEKGNDASAIVYFTESGSSITVRESYEDIIAKFHAL
ncbi:TPA: hypothetical protein L3375_004331 [Escherichia coli]|uniref:hypothetical protein n=1 Tax=Escherichia coli TaxID=562 RepID=UPI000BDE8C38|nr:hypothetical protein [Escherichia coli]EHT4227783.1 hypothetical protein [Escherichia coli]HBN7099951.1 hypothetical protein [Escherichia coli]HDY2862932.1 hypothetical protein [Escherichia coli]